MTTSDAIWWAAAILPGPMWYLWRRWRERHVQRLASELREKMMRRERFAGVVRLPGTKGEVAFLTIENEDAP